MRPVNKGPAPLPAFRDYRDARPHLFSKIGVHCSYCEMPIDNMGEVEHVIPLEHGGAEDQWDNYLLSCRYCNGSKSDRNQQRTGYYWPDQDNTFRAFEYRMNRPVAPAQNLSNEEKRIANQMIELLGLHKHPGTALAPSERDARPFSKDRAWLLAYDLLEDWNSQPTPRNAISIARTARERGHFSIFMEVFKNCVEVRQQLIEQYPGTAKDCFDAETNPIKRQNGNL